MHGDSPGMPNNSAKRGHRVGLVRSWEPPIDHSEVFKQLIADELRQGRLTSGRRRRIVRYAASLGLSAVQIGEVVKACHSEAMSSDDPIERHHALRLQEIDEPNPSLGLKIAIIAALAVLLYLVVGSCL